MGVRKRDLDEIDQNSDELWNHERPTQYEDSVYTFNGIGTINSTGEVDVDFIRTNNFWSEGAKISSGSIYFFGKLGHREGFLTIH